MTPPNLVSNCFTLPLPPSTEPHSHPQASFLRSHRIQPQQTNPPVPIILGSTLHPKPDFSALEMCASKKDEILNPSLEPFSQLRKRSATCPATIPVPNFSPIAHFDDRSFLALWRIGSTFDIFNRRRTRRTAFGEVRARYSRPESRLCTWTEKDGLPCPSEAEKIPEAVVALDAQRAVLETIFFFRAESTCRSFQGRGRRMVSGFLISRFHRSVGTCI